MEKIITLIIYNDIENPLNFLLVEGDYSRFHGVSVNTVNGNGFEEEFCNWMFDAETGMRNHDGWTTDKRLLENKEWNRVAICTFIP